MIFKSSTTNAIKSVLESCELKTDCVEPSSAGDSVSNSSPDGIGLTVEPSPQGERADAGERARPINIQKTASEGLPEAKNESHAEDDWDALEELLEASEDEPEVVMGPLFPFGSDLYVKIVQNSAPSLARMCTVNELQQFNKSCPVDHLLVRTIVGVEKTVPAISASAR